MSADTSSRCWSNLGGPPEDLAGYVDGESHLILLEEEGWELRPYQRHAAESFWHGGSGWSFCHAAPARRWWAPPPWE